MTGEEGSGAVCTCASNTVTVAGAANAAKGRTRSATARQVVWQGRMAVYRGKSSSPVSRVCIGKPAHNIPTRDADGRFARGPNEPSSEAAAAQRRVTPSAGAPPSARVGAGDESGRSGSAGRRVLRPSRLVHHLTFRESTVWRRIAVNDDVRIETSSSPDPSPPSVGRSPPCTDPGEEHRGRLAFPEVHPDGHSPSTGRRGRERLESGSR